VAHVREEEGIQTEAILQQAAPARRSVSDTRSAQCRLQASHNLAVLCRFPVETGRHVRHVRSQSCSD
jgi:hypothetical protein